MSRPIHISLSPNLEADDIKLTLETLLTGPLPQATARVEAWFKDYLSVETALAFNSGRSALWALLKACGIHEGDEVLLQAFTCVAVPNSVLWVNATPVYVDIKKETYNLDPQDLERKITPRSKAVIIQHAFGQPAAIKEIKAICEKRKLALIEDCALSLGATYDGKKVGTFGDAAFFSFGRDKVVSSVFGGIAVTSRSDIASKLKDIHFKLPSPRRLWVLQQLLHPLLTPLVLATYNILGIGKLLLLVAQKIRLLSRAVYTQEKRGKRPTIFPATFSDRLATLALNQLHKLERFNRHRRELARVYDEILGETRALLPPKNKDAVYLRFTIQTPKAQYLFETAKQGGIMLGDWYQSVIVPVENPSLVGYERGSCPTAETMVTHTVNLPTYPTLSVEQAQELGRKIKRWLQ